MRLAIYPMPNYRLSDAPTLRIDRIERSAPTLPLMERVAFWATWAAIGAWCGVAVYLLIEFGHLTLLVPR